MSTLEEGGYQFDAVHERYAQLVRSGKVIFRTTWSGALVGVNKRYTVSRTKGSARIILSAEYRSFRKALCDAFWARRMGQGSVDDADYPVFAPQYRSPAPTHEGTCSLLVVQQSRHDFDACIKPVADSLEHAGVIANDNLITSATLVKEGKPKGVKGRLHILVLGEPDG